MKIMDTAEILSTLCKRKFKSCTVFRTSAFIANACEPMRAIICVINYGTKNYIY